MTNRRECEPNDKSKYVQHNLLSIPPALAIRSTSVAGGAAKPATDRQHISHLPHRPRFTHAPLPPDLDSLVVTASSCAMAPSTRPPVPLATLRESSVLNARPQEFSVISWIKAAESAFRNANDKWSLAQRPGADPALVETAFVASRKGAE